MDYDEIYIWEKDDCFGVLLKFLEINLEKKGYCFVGCNLFGVNVFFVRKDFVFDKFLVFFIVENYY